jgi:hypothetical protein
MRKRHAQPHRERGRTSPRQGKRPSVSQHGWALLLCLLVGCRRAPLITRPAWRAHGTAADTREHVVSRGPLDGSVGPGDGWRSTWRMQPGWARLMTAGAWATYFAAAKCQAAGAGTGLVGARRRCWHRADRQSGSHQTVRMVWYNARHLSRTRLWEQEHWHEVSAARLVVLD